MNRPAAALTSSQADALVRDTEPYLSCGACFELMDAWVEAQCDVSVNEELVGMREHLAGCAACAEEAESLAALVRE